MASQIADKTVVIRYRDIERALPTPKQEMHYDVFISYRRGTANALVRLLQVELQRRGLRAFLDRDIRYGVFDETLLRRIAESPSFLIVLTPNSLDRCSDPDDWLRKEIAHAIDNNRNIIPLLVDSFQFTPELTRGLDQAIQKLSHYHAVDYSDPYSDESIERIVEIVKEHKIPRIRKFWWGVATTVMTMAILIFAIRLLRNIPAPDVNDGAPYVFIHGNSTFQMGCNKDWDGKEVDWQCGPDEKPLHPVTMVNSFWLGQTPVTQAAFQKVMHYNPSYFRGDPLPVTNVSWTEASDYCRAIGRRLPFEAEFEYAARAGNVNSIYGNVDGNLKDHLNAVAWWSENSDKKIHEVAQKQPNAWKLYDLLGNVWQWVQDWYDKDYYQNFLVKAPIVDPTGPLSSPSDERVARGGSWNDGPGNVRVSVRYNLAPTAKLRNVGFRCAGGSDPFNKVSDFSP